MWDRKRPLFERTGARAEVLEEREISICAKKVKSVYSNTIEEIECSANDVA